VGSLANAAPSLALPLKNPSSRDVAPHLLRGNCLIKNKLNSYNGFTLIEVLIALAVLAISLTALVQSTSTNIRDSNYLRDKTVAVWVATDSMSQIQLGLVKFPQGSDKIEMTTKMLGQEWSWQAISSKTPDPYTTKVVITVSKINEKQPLIIFPSFMQTFPP
jgi:general secretion pathway protein I